MTTSQKKESKIASMFRKRRVSVLNAADRNEEWYIHLSPAGFMAALTAVILILFISISILVSYTPLLEFIPGYRANANRSREGLINNIMRMDSMERQMRDMLTYNQNIALIMDGKSPIVRTIADADSTRLDKTLVMPSYEDSLLRRQMEGDGIYSLKQSGMSKGRGAKIEMTTPMTGIITSHFNIRENNFGIALTSTPATQVMAIADGAVVMKSWAPQQGYIIVLQHDNNFISIYKNLSNITASEGQIVTAGEVIGYNGSAEEAAIESATKQITFELWFDGKPVDPENYIIF